MVKCESLCFRLVSLFTSFAVYACLSYRSFVSFASNPSSSWILILHVLFLRETWFLRILCKLCFSLYFFILYQGCFPFLLFLGHLVWALFLCLRITFLLFRFASILLLPALVFLRSVSGSLLVCLLLPMDRALFATFAGHGTLIGDPCFVFTLVSVLKFPSHSTL